MVRRSVFRTASFECCMTLSYFMAATPTRMAMIEITIISSMSVNPAWYAPDRGFFQAEDGIRDGNFLFNWKPRTNYQSEYFVPSSPVPVDFADTSTKFFPPHLVESGSCRKGRR